MATAIEWTDETWNPVTGCSKVSPGCAHCYAERIELRFGRSLKPWTPENAAENVKLHPERLDAPLRWRKPRMVFVNSMSDLFHELVLDPFIGSAVTARQAHRHGVRCIGIELNPDYAEIAWHRTRQLALLAS